MCSYRIFIYLLFTNLFCLWNPQKIVKREVQTSANRCLLLHFGMNRIIFRVYPLASMHVLNFAFFFLNMCDMSF